MSIELGGCSFSFGRKPLRDSLLLLKSMGFDVVDIGASPGNAQIDQMAAATEPLKLAAEVRELIQQVGLRPEECFVLDFGPPINHPDENVWQRTRELFKGVARFAALIECRSIMLIPGIVHPEIGRARSFDRAVEKLKELTQISQHMGLQLNIEACEPSIAEDPRDAKQLCEQVPGLGLTLDYSHFIDPGHTQTSVEPLHQFAKHFHFRQAAPRKRVETVDKGTIDFGRVLSLLQQQSYTGTLAVEYVDCEETEKCGVDVLPETVKLRAQLLELLGALENPSPAFKNGRYA